jgi:hypothetical protein
MGFNIFEPSDKRKILEEMAKSIIQLQKNRILNQIQPDGKPYPALKPSTKEGKAGTAYYFKRDGKVIRVGKPSYRKSKYPDKRMMDTGDFRNNAFEYKILDDNTLSINISTLPHRFLKDFSRNESTAKSIHNDKMNRKTKKRSLGKSAGSNVTYQDIFEFNTNSDSPFEKKGRRSSRNAGCSSFGLNNNDMSEYENKIMTAGARLLGEKIEQYFKKALGQ